jgi:hypothetical protein
MRHAKTCFNGKLNFYQLGVKWAASDARDSLLARYFVYPGYLLDVPQNLTGYHQSCWIYTHSLDDLFQRDRDHHSNDRHSHHGSVSCFFDNHCGCLNHFDSCHDTVQAVTLEEETLTARVRSHSMSESPLDVTGAYLIGEKHLSHRASP